MACNIPTDTAHLFPVTCDLNYINENQSTCRIYIYIYIYSVSTYFLRGFKWRHSINSSGITPMGFFMRSHIKITVYQSRVTEIALLKRRIAESTMTVHAAMFHRTWKELVYVLHIVRPTKGAHTETSWGNLKTCENLNTRHSKVHVSSPICPRHVMSWNHNKVHVSSPICPRHMMSWSYSKV